MIALLLWLACSGSTGELRGAVDDTGDSGEAAVDEACPPEMAAVEDFCIDRWEGHLDGGDPYAVPTAGVAASAAAAIPQGYISGDVAEVACAAAGKRLCRLDEWLRACQGASGQTYPYGDSYDPTACNTERDQHPVVELFGSDADWSPAQMNDPRLNQLPGSLAPSGSYERCLSDDGVYDLHGNLHEWIADADGSFKGGFYVDAVINGDGCHYRTTAHTTGYHDYSTGFRCCTSGTQ